MIMLIGPNGVGKTKIAYELARRNSGEIINLDRTYLYRHFPLTTGMQDTLKEQGVARHLYGLQDPGEDSFSPDEFSEMVVASEAKIRKNRKVAIAEGGSTLYVPPLLELNSKQKIFRNVIGLRFSRHHEIEKQYLRRIEQALDEGLAREIETNLRQYSDSFIIRECHFAVPIVRYLKKEINFVEAKSEILKRCLDYKDRQLKLFSQYSEIKWIEVSDFEETYFKINSIISETGS